jgi:hypothetical protein
MSRHDSGRRSLLTPKMVAAIGYGDQLNGGRGVSDGGGGRGDGGRHLC